VSEDFVMILKWAHPNGCPGVFITEYKGFRLGIIPVGSAEWDGLINRRVCSGADDLEVIELELIQKIDTDHKAAPPPG
jgi:hypothetical protein